MSIELMIFSIWCASSVTAPPPLLDPRDPASSLGGAIARQSLREPLDRIEAHLRKAGDRVPRDRVLPIVRELFYAPWSLPEVARSLGDATSGSRAGGAIAATVALAFDLEPPGDEIVGNYVIERPMQAVRHLDFFARGGDAMVQAALAPIVEGAADAEALRASLRADCLRLLEIAERTPMPRDEDAECALRVAQAARKIDLDSLARAIALADTDMVIDADWTTFETKPIPEALAGAIEGDILMAMPIPPLGWCVVGGPGPNRYDMSRVAAVFDTGGDDIYEWHGDVDGSRVVIDLAGNDRSLSTGPVGPGGALLGFTYVRDLAGNDRYEGVTLACGAAMLGAAILIDDAGDDVHIARSWSQGAGFFGVGALIDLAGSDRYEGRILCQGVGGPRALGMLVDRAGNDLYSVRGAPSAYGTPATDRGFSQGVGYGLRRELPGGIGLLVDDSGDDRYEGGEFSQGGGYFFSLGVLADRTGHDLYRGDRYAQGFAAHQAFGILLDDAGGDLYFSRTAAGQGAAWDESVAMLIDREGDDHYRGDGLSQGAAAQQAIGALVDLGGRDAFIARGESAQGGAGGNEYHFAECACFSLGVLLTRGTDARFSSDRPRGASLQSRIVDGDPAASRAFGLRIDESAPR